MFQFSGFAPITGYPDIHRDGLPHSDIHGSAPLAGPRGFSQLGTSFFASRSLGIPRAPLFTYSSHGTPFCKGPVQSFFSRDIADAEYSTLLHFLLNMSKNLIPGPYGRGMRNGIQNNTPPGLSRKEVFQPHLPVRLPCYDLAPVTGSTLNGSSRLPPSGLPDFHGLTGGVYKVRERIHRAMADARLLAIPASRGRVADPDPN